MSKTATKNSVQSGKTRETGRQGKSIVYHTIRLNSTKILGISITTDPKKTILEYIQKYLEKPQEKPLVIATPNPEQVVYAHGDSHFAQIINRADVALPDGIGLALAMRLKRIPGVEFMKELVAMAAKQGFPIALIGGRSGVAVKALECLQRKYPGLRGWAAEPEKEHVFKKIRETKPKVVFVGLGAPKQELFIARLARQFQISNFKFQIVFMSVGGSFDIIAGGIPRAPSFVRTIGLEWLWRLILEPWRFGRQLRLLRFFWLVCIRGRD